MSLSTLRHNPYRTTHVFPCTTQFTFSMKKLFLAAVSLALSFAAHAGSLFVSNSTDCTFVMAIHAHDANNSAPCSYSTGYFDVPIGAALAYNNVTVLNGVVGWEDPNGRYLDKHGTDRFGLGRRIILHGQFYDRRYSFRLCPGHERKRSLQYLQRSGIHRLDAVAQREYTG